MSELVASGRVESLCINGTLVERIIFEQDGPCGDRHSGLTRRLSGHDSDYIRTSALEKGNVIFNCRSWTGLSKEEIMGVEGSLGVSIPPGCLLENIIFSGIPDFSELCPATRLVFPKKGTTENQQTILAVWEKNVPCRTVGERLEQLHRQENLKTDFIAQARDKRGVMGFVFATGYVEVGDEVLVYDPV